jgi:uncharacterized YigZ family protein
MTSYESIMSSIEFQPEPIKGSRFVVRVFTIESESKCFLKLEEIRKLFPDASHHCWAFRLFQDERCRSSDDGEPGGSAGRPILAQIIGHELFDVCVVVVRYFGGTKLGVGGLIRAYGGSAGQALDQCQRVTRYSLRSLTIVHAYGDTNAVQQVLGQDCVTVLHANYEEKVVIHLTVIDSEFQSLCDSLVDRTSGRVELLIE